MNSAVGFLLNGQPTRLEAPPLERLSEALRERCGLTGVKVGCNAGDCGACTRADRRRAGRRLHDGGRASRRSPRDDNRRPAGFRPGRLELARRISCARRGAMRHVHARGARRRRRAFTRQPRAERERDRRRSRWRALPLHRLSRNSRRRGGGGCGEVRRAIGAQRQREAPGSLRCARDDGGAVGARLPRLDGSRKLDGSEIFGADAWPGRLVACAKSIRSPHDHATFDFGDLAAWAAKHPGVVAVFTAKDVPGVNRFGAIPAFADQPALAESRRALPRRRGGARRRRG